MSRGSKKSQRTLAIMDEVRNTRATFTEIAERYSITRERVRQIAKSAGVVGIPRRKEITEVDRTQRRYALGYSAGAFVRAINRALTVIDCRYCARCHRAVPGFSQGHCHQCKAENTRRWSSINRERVLEWKQANADKVLAYQRRYQQSEKGKAARKAARLCEEERNLTARKGRGKRRWDTPQTSKASSR